MESSYVENEVKTELFLNFLDFLSLFTSPVTGSIDKFIESASEISLPYFFNNTRSFKRLLSNLNRVKDQPSRDFTNLNRSTRYPVESQLCIEDTPLFEYIFSHYVAIESRFHNSPKSSDATNCVHYFSDEGRYFFGTLLQILSSLTVPYTKKGSVIMSSRFLNTVFKKLYEVYHDGQLGKTEPIERFHFLTNTEGIFQLSLLKRIYDSYNNFFCGKTEPSNIVLDEIIRSEVENWDGFTFANLYFLLGFKSSLHLIDDLTKCPLSTIRQQIWNTYNSQYFELGEKYAQYGYLNIPFCQKELPLPSDPSAVADITQEMSDCFFYIMMKIFRCFPTMKDKDSKKNELESPSFQPTVKLKEQIVSYLASNNTKNTSWSLLESDNPESILINSLPHEYFDHQVAYSFYLPPYSRALEGHIDQMYEGYGINQYLKHILAQSKLSQKWITSKKRQSKVSKKE